MKRDRSPRLTYSRLKTRPLEEEDRGQFVVRLSQLPKPGKQLTPEEEKARQEEAQNLIKKIGQEKKQREREKVKKDLMKKRRESEMRAKDNAQQAQMKDQLQELQQMNIADRESRIAERSYKL